MLPYKVPDLGRSEVSRPTSSQAHFFPVSISPGQVRQPCFRFCWPLLTQAGQVRVLCSSSAQFFCLPPTPGKQVKRTWSFHPIYTLLSLWACPDWRDQSLPTLLSSVHFCLSAYLPWMCMLEILGPPAPTNFFHPLLTQAGTARRKTLPLLPPHTTATVHMPNEQVRRQNPPTPVSHAPHSLSSLVHKVRGSMISSPYTCSYNVLWTSHLEVWGCNPTVDFT